LTMASNSSQNVIEIGLLREPPPILVKDEDKEEDVLSSFSSAK